MTNSSLFLTFKGKIITPVIFPPVVEVFTYMLGSIWSNQIDIVIHRDAEGLIAPALKTRTVFRTKNYKGSTPSLTFCSSKRGVSYENYLPPSLFAIIYLLATKVTSSNFSFKLGCKLIENNHLKQIPSNKCIELRIKL